MLIPRFEQLGGVVSLDIARGLHVPHDGGRVAARVGEHIEKESAVVPPAGVMGIDRGGEIEITEEFMPGFHAAMQDVLGFLGEKRVYFDTLSCEVRLRISPVTKEMLSRRIGVRVCA